LANITKYLKAFFFLAALIAAPFPLLLFVDAERGNREGIALAKELAIDGAKTPTEEGTERLLSGEGREDGP
jgi:UMF1 family MFS transporter